MIIGVSHGCFDMLHIGHIHHLKLCKSFLDLHRKPNKLIVLLSSDIRVQRTKGDDRPFLPQEHRQSCLEQLRSVDEVEIITDPLKRLREIKPHFYFKSDDTDQTTQMFQVEEHCVKRFNGQVVFTEVLYHIHTSHYAKPGEIWQT